MAPTPPPQLSIPTSAPPINPRSEVSPEPEQPTKSREGCSNCRIPEPPAPPPTVQTIPQPLQTPLIPPKTSQPPSLDQPSSRSNGNINEESQSYDQDQSTYDSGDQPQNNQENQYQSQDQSNQGQDSSNQGQDQNSQDQNQNSQDQSNQNQGRQNQIQDQGENQSQDQNEDQRNYENQNQGQDQTSYDQGSQDEAVQEYGSQAQQDYSINQDLPQINVQQSSEGNDQQYANDPQDNPQGREDSNDIPLDNEVNDPTVDIRSGTNTPNNDPLPSLRSKPGTVEKMQELLGDILYKFNYTVGYHGHHEQGDQAGTKEGGYFSIGRDGFKRTVSYKANSNGFQPKVKVEKVSLEETPQPETEKENKRHDYEFKWFFKNDE